MKRVLFKMQTLCKIDCLSDVSYFSLQKKKSERQLVLEREWSEKIIDSYCVCAYVCAFSRPWSLQNIYITYTYLIMTKDFWP